MPVWGSNIIQKNSNTTSTDSTFTNALINAYKGLSRAKNKSYYLNVSAGVFKMLSSGDRVWLSLWGRIDGNKPIDSFTLSSTDYIAADSSAVRDNYNDRHYSNSDFILTAGYAIQLPKSWDLRTTAGLEYQYERTHNTTYRLEQLENFDVNNYDVLPSNKQLLDPVIDGSSYNYSLYSKGISCDVSLTKDFGKNRYFSISFNGHWNREKINYYRPHCADTTAKKWIPFINGWIRYNKSGKNKLELEYYVQHLGHTISSLMPYTDTTNPLYVMINNTALKGQTYHNLTAYISRTMLRDMNVYFDASFTTYFNGTGTKTLYNQKTGVSTYMYDNVNGDWNTKLKVGLSSSLDEKKRWKIDSRIELEYKHSVDFDILYSDGSAADLEYMMTHENLSRVNTARPGTYAKLSYRNGNFSWSVNGKINGIFSNGDRENFQNVNAADYQYGATLQYNILPWKISIGTDITMFSRRGYNMSEMNTDDLVGTLKSPALSSAASSLPKSGLSTYYDECQIKSSASMRRAALKPGITPFRATICSPSPAS